MRHVLSNVETPNIRLVCCVEGAGIQKKARGTPSGVIDIFFLALYFSVHRIESTSTFVPAPSKDDTPPECLEFLNSKTLGAQAVDFDAYY